MKTSEFDYYLPEELIAQTPLKDRSSSRLLVVDKNKKTYEDKVFTNTIKAIHGAEVKRDDCFGSFDYVECNIKDNTVFKMDNVRAQVSTNTVFGCKYPSSAVFGVDVFPKKETLTENDAQTFSAQYYTGPGAIIPIKLVIPNQNQGDFVKHTVIDYTQEDGTTNRLFLYDIFKPLDVVDSFCWCLRNDYGY